MYWPLRFAFLAFLLLARDRHQNVKLYDSNYEMYEPMVSIRYERAVGISFPSVLAHNMSCVVAVQDDELQQSTWAEPDIANTGRMCWPRAQL